jgi:hypothetical protein
MKERDLLPIELEGERNLREELRAGAKTLPSGHGSLGEGLSAISYQ